MKMSNAGDFIINNGVLEKYCRYGCKEYFNHNKELLFYERQKEIITKIETLDLED